MSRDREITLFRASAFRRARLDVATGGQQILGSWWHDVIHRPAKYHGHAPAIPLNSNMD
jgi:hypothetical protein